MGQGAAVILLFSGAAALVNIGYTSGLAIGPDKSLVALLGCLAVAAGLGIALLVSGGRGGHSDLQNSAK